MAGRPKAQLILSAAEREQLEAWTRRRRTAQALALRSQIVLDCAGGAQNQDVAKRLRCTPQTVCKWRNRFVRLRLDGLLDAPRPGAPRTIDDARVDKVIAMTLEQRPRNATQWSTRTMAQASGLTQTAVSRIWRTFGLQPHRQETFKLSTDPLFVAKTRDIVGLYLDPPTKAMVLCVDEKSQIQALDRTQPGLPLKKGRCGTMTHDYKRHGTTTLFAALELLQGKVIGQCYKRHRHQEFLRFLRRLDREFAQPWALHLVLDNYGTHAEAEVQAWLKKHPRFVLHFVPTSCSWLNLVERWFGELTSKRIRRGSFLSVPDLIAAIEELLEAWNENPQPFVWTASVESIMAKLSGCRQTLEQIQPGCTLPRPRKQPKRLYS